MASPLAEAAKAIRADIKAAVAARSLPPHPAGITFRVRCERAALMSVIDIAVQNAPRSWAYTAARGGGIRSSDAVLQLRAALTRIAARRYPPDDQGRFVTADIDFETVTEG